MKTALAGVPWLPADVVAELYTLVLRDGAELFYTSLDVDINYGGETYLSQAFNLERGPIKTSVGSEVDDVELTIYPHQADTIEGLSFPRFVLNGGLDGAWLTIHRARQSRVTHLFKGMVTDAGADLTQLKLTVSAPISLLNIDMPRNKFSPGCIWSVYDTGCGLSRAAYAVNGTVSAGSNTRRIFCNLTQADGYFDLGKVEFSSGANAGAVRSIRDYTNRRASHLLRGLTWLYNLPRIAR